MSPRSTEGPEARHGTHDGDSTHFHRNPHSQIRVEQGGRVWKRQVVLVRGDPSPRGEAGRGVEWRRKRRRRAMVASEGPGGGGGGGCIRRAESPREKGQRPDCPREAGEGKEGVGLQLPLNQILLFFRVREV
jgi:hypothetical protein